MKSQKLTITKVNVLKLQLLNNTKFKQHMTTKQTCIDLSNKCKLLNKYFNLKKETVDTQKRIREIRKILNMNIQDKPTKLGYEKLLIKNQEKVDKNKELILEIKKIVECE